MFVCHKAILSWVGNELQVIPEPIPQPPASTQVSPLPRPCVAGGDWGGLGVRGEGGKGGEGGEGGEGETAASGEGVGVRGEGGAGGEGEGEGHSGAGGRES